jgi:hypothetical protein
VARPDRCINPTSSEPIQLHISARTAQ